MKDLRKNLLESSPALVSNCFQGEDFERNLTGLTCSSRMTVLELIRLLKDFSLISSIIESSLRVYIAS